MLHYMTRMCRGGDGVRLFRLWLPDLLTYFNSFAFSGSLPYSVVFIGRRETFVLTTRR